MADLHKGIEASLAGDYAVAMREFRPLAEEGHAEAQSALGLMYEKGQGVARDDTQAVAWWRKSAEQGYAGAQYALGIMYAAGRGVAQDDAQALRWCRKISFKM